MLRSLVGWFAKNPLYAVCAALGLALGVATVRLRIEKAHVRQLGFDKIGLEAQLDTTRTVSVKTQRALIAMYGRDWKAWQRLVVQRDFRNDSLGKVLGQKTAFAGSLTIQLAALQREIATSPVTVTADDVREADFADSSGSVHVRGKASLPPAPRAGTVNLWITRGPLQADVVLGCLARNAEGLRPAQVTILLSDTLATVRLGRQQASKEVCNAAVVHQGMSLKTAVQVAGAAVAVWEGGKLLLRVLNVLPKKE